MGIEIKFKNQGIIMIVRFFNIAASFSIQNLKNTYPTAGIRNITRDFKRIIFLDYDERNLENEIIPELKYLQHKFKISTFYIFKSSKDSYHAICLDKLKLHEYIKVLKESTCDPAYKGLLEKPMKREWVLRFLPKDKKQMPHYVGELLVNYDFYEKSYSHGKFLNLHYGIPVDGIKKFDKYEELPIVAYTSVKK